MDRFARVTFAEALRAVKKFRERFGHAAKVTAQEDDQHRDEDVRE